MHRHAGHHRRVGHPHPPGPGLVGLAHTVARGATGIQIGEGNLQINYSYRLTVADELAPPPLVSVSGTVDSPYRGLRAFGERDAAFFFGRETSATEVLDSMSRHLRGTGLLMVSGVSGAGKSSLLQAGVLPRLRGAGLASAPKAMSWPCLIFTPTRAPLDEMAVRVASLTGSDAPEVRRGLAADPAGFALTARQAALSRAGGWAEHADDASPPPRLLLIVDQFEQLFTQCDDEEQRRAFIEALHAAARVTSYQASAALVVLVMRADFEARCADYPLLAEAVQHRYLVTAMTDRQLRLAITEPARKSGSQVDGDLVDVLLREVSTRRPAPSPVASSPGTVSGAGVLPLLSHALDQAWRNRCGDALTLADYERTGGVEGAVADSAVRAFGQLTPAQQAVARQVFTRLTATSSDGTDTAKRAIRVELIADRTAEGVRDVEAVLEAFAAERLLTLAADTVEISHEVLLTAWDLLRDVWLPETHADRIVRSRLDNVAADWDRGARDRSYLYSGTLLQAAVETVARIRADSSRHLPLSRTESDFLHASDQARHWRARRRQGIIAFLSALVVGLSGVAVVAIDAEREAIHQRDNAQSGKLISQSESSIAETDPALAKLESVAAWRLDPSPQARDAMLDAAGLPGIGVLGGTGSAVNAVAISPDSRILAVGGEDGKVRLWDLDTGRELGNPLYNKDGPLTSVAFSPDGKTLAVAGNTVVLLWNLTTHGQIGHALRPGADAVSTVAFSPSGRTLAVTAGSSVQLWGAVTQRLVKTLSTDPAPRNSGTLVVSVAFSEDGETLAAGGVVAGPTQSSTVWLWNAARWFFTCCASSATIRSQRTSASLPASRSRVPYVVTTT